MPLGPPTAPPEVTDRAWTGETDNVWRVEKTTEFETYSNGLRIENRYTTTNRRRFFRYINRQRNLEVSKDWYSEPVGIVFHTTESSLVPFQPEQNGALLRNTSNLAEYVRGKKSYHFLIDRVGRVFRLVDEPDAANHAGNSVWADDALAWIGLNDSFIGISFEARTEPGSTDPNVSPAQVHSGRILTEMLRKKYRIKAENCVTHAQVSVNPHNMKIGYHADWASHFPFEEMALPNNYDLPPASLTLFGFRYDENFLTSIGLRKWAGLSVADEELRQQSAAQRLGPEQNRQRLASRYWQLMELLKAASESEKEER
jgi:N-acetylmuramoyl-L-alanine amidase